MSVGSATAKKSPPSSPRGLTLGSMNIATWNLHNQAGTRIVFPEAAHAAIALGADVIVFTEYFPREHDNQIRSTLSQGGWSNQCISEDPTGKENRVLIVSKSPMAPMIFDRPSLEDRQLCANVLGVELTSLGISVLGVRIPAYEPEIARLRIPAWGWLEKTATSLNGRPSVIIGDLNAKESYGRLKRILAKRVASRRTWRTDLLWLPRKDLRNRSHPCDKSLHH